MYSYLKVIFLDQNMNNIKLEIVTLHYYLIIIIIYVDTCNVMIYYKDVMKADTSVSIKTGGIIMNLRKKAMYSAGFMATTMLLAACGNNEDTDTANNGEGNEEQTTITFWAAPNPTQERFWQQQAEDFMAENEDIVVEVSQMQESPSSEATIQSAVASNTAPTISENITRSFGAQLVNSEVVIPLNELEGFDELIENRAMTNTIETWSFADGNQYIMPVYSNPILFGWRTDLLEEIGVNEVPQTYSDLIEVAELLSEDSNRVVWAKADLSDSTGWMRYFDFFPMYNAASEGNGFIEGSDLIADEEAGTELLGLMDSLRENNALLTSPDTDPFENGTSVMADLGPWAFPNWSEQYPELVYGENYEVTPPVVPDSMETNEGAYTFADAKGVVVYEQATEEERNAAMVFLEYVFSDIENDLDWLETTSLIPARDDAAESEEFAEYFEENPQMMVYAENVPNAVPPMDNADFNSLMEIIGEEAWNPVVRGDKEAQGAWEDMVEALQGELE